MNLTVQWKLYSVLWRGNGRRSQWQAKSVTDSGTLNHLFTSKVESPYFILFGTGNLDCDHWVRVQGQVALRALCLCSVFVTVDTNSCKSIVLLIPSGANARVYNSPISHHVSFSSRTCCVHLNALDSPPKVPLKLKPYSTALAKVP